MYWAHGLLPLGMHFFYMNSSVHIKHNMAICILKPFGASQSQVWFGVWFSRFLSLSVWHSPESIPILLYSTISSNIWVLLRYQALCHVTLEIMLSFFFKTWWTYQLHAGSCWMPYAMAYLATWIGYNSLKLNNFSQNVDPSFNSQCTFQPAVDSLRVSCPLTTIFWSSSPRAEQSFCDQVMYLVKDIHYHWHHIWHTPILQWC